MKRTLFFLLVLFAFSKLTFAQDFPYGSVTDEEINMKSYANDTSADAVVLQEFGRTKIALVTDENIRQIFEYHVKIKIFDNKGFDNGTVEIPVYHSNEDADSYETVEDVKGITWYKDDDGATKKIALEKQKIIPVSEGKHLAIYKFAMPGMRKGCVIEYSYRKISPYFQHLQPWLFQEGIPKIYSEYEVHIPAYFRYNISLKGNLKLSKNTSAVERSCFTVNSGISAADCSVLVYGMNNIPAFISEDHMTSAKNYLSAINFVETDFTSPYNDAKYKVTKDWKDVEYLLKNELYFGDQLKKKGLFKERIVPVITGKNDELSKAKAIYYYVQHLFKWNKRNGFVADDGINAALETHTGNAGDINLALINALMAAGLNVDAVLLSTRKNGTVSSLYPVLDDFNYVIAKADIDGQTYLLDATDPELPFGMLPFRCLNGRGREYSLNKPSDWIDINPPQKQKSTYTLDFTLQDDGKLKGTFISYATGYDAYEKRDSIKKFNTTDEYIEDYNSKSPRVKVLKAEIMNLDSLDQPLIEKYDLEIEPVKKTGDADLAFSPFFWNRLDVNPFKLEERSYPVDMGMASDKRLTLTVHLPDQYTVETPPQTIAVGMPNDGGKVITNFDQTAHSFTFSQVLQVNKAVYDPNDYPYLKEFYNKIVQSEKAEIILKKK